MAVPAQAQPANTNQMPLAPQPAQPVQAQPVAQPVQAQPVQPAQPAPVMIPVDAPPAAPTPEVVVVPQPAQPVSQPVTQPVQPVITAPEPTPAAQTQPDPTPTIPTPAPVAPVPYQDIGIPALDAAAKLVAAHGFDPVVLSQEIQTQGELSAPTRAALEAKLGADQVTLLASTYTSEIKNAETQANARNQAVYDAVGGKETWDALAEWTTKPEAGLSPEAADAYNEMLAAGGVQAELAAKALKEAYMASPGFKQNNPAIVTPDAAVPAQTQVQAISRRQYTEQRKAAIRTGNAAEVAALDQRARLTMEKLPEQWRVSAIIN